MTESAHPSRAIGDAAPIGVFDSGYGGLTVLREMMERLPGESFVFVGDSARCPYGPRDLAEVDGFVQQICAYLVSRECKLIVIACNTATAAGLAHAQRTFDVPILGVVEPGARAAAHVTRNRKVGVIATAATIDSNAYADAIRHIDAGITVFSTATPRFVEIAERGLRMAEGPVEGLLSDAAKVYVRPEFSAIARDYLDPLKRCGVDTLVLGCTHYPLLQPLIGSVMGLDVTLVSSAEETARDVEAVLRRKGALAPEGAEPKAEYLTTGRALDEFRRFGSRVLAVPMGEVAHVDLGGGSGREGDPMRTVVVATNNAHKAREIAGAIDLEGLGFMTLAEAGLASDPEETEETFVGNARIKARAAWERARQAGMRACVLADDSGLVVDALEGAPGVRSARYAGEPCDDAANNAKLLAALEGVSQDDRTARFACAMVFLDEEGQETVAEGTVEGRIALAPAGEGGFGYDPLFLPDAYGGARTLAEATQEEKGTISHRGNALRALRESLSQARG